MDTERAEPQSQASQGEDDELEVDDLSQVGGGGNGGVIILGFGSEGSAGSVV